MTTVKRDVLVHAEPATVWDAVRDVGALHTRLAPGVVTATEMEPPGAVMVRHVTFSSGLRLRERIVDIDDDERRLVWSIEGEGVVHHNGSLQVSRAGPGQTKVVWIADVLPHALATDFAPLMEAGLAAMAAHLSKG